VSTGFTVEVGQVGSILEGRNNVRSSASALKIKYIADEWHPSKPYVKMWCPSGPGVTMCAAPEKPAKADGRRGDRTAQSTERSRDA
jgi:hypothetical protein